MYVGSHKIHGHCGSSAQKTETKTNTKNCAAAPFSKALNQAKASCKSPIAANQGHKGHAGHGGTHHGHVAAPNGKHFGHHVKPIGSHHGHHGHGHVHGKHTNPHFGHAVLHKGHSLLKPGSCHHAKPPVSGTGGTSNTAQKTLQLTMQSQTYMSVNYSSYSSYSVANAVGANLNSLKGVGGYSFTNGAAFASAFKTATAAGLYSMTRTDRFYTGANTLVSQHGYKISDLIDNKTGNLCPNKLKTAYQKHGLATLFDGLQKDWELEYKVDMSFQITMNAMMNDAKNKMDDGESMLSFYKMLMKNFIEDKSEGAASLDDLYVENGKIMGLPPILDKIINSIQTAQSTNPNEKPDDAKSVLKEILKKGVKNIPDLTINIALKKEDNSSAEAA